VPTRWTTIGALFEAALDRPAAERRAWLREACDDAELRQEVRRLLAAHERASGILDAPPPLRGVLPQALAEGEADVLYDGERVGPYRILRELGRGGMGTVYLAERDDAQFTRRVALKVLRREVAGGEHGRRFAAEQQILAALTHPNVARLYDAGVAATGRPYFAMEYVEGRPVAAYCDAERLTVSERLRLFRRVCDAVEYAHRNLVVHRDLKPEHVLITAGGEVKLLDFGIAKLLDAEAAGLRHPPPVTRTGMRPMTPAYASPEQVRNEPITTASDVYALGVLLYELLAGRRPYRLAGRSPSGVERAVCEEEPPAPSAVVTGRSGEAPPEGTADAPSAADVARARGTTPERLRRRLRGDLDTIVLKALRKEPERRYGSAAALAEDLRRHLDGHPVRARPDSRAYRTRKFVRRHRWGVAVAAVLALLLAGYAATVTVQSHRIAEERDRARLEAMKAAHVKDFLVDLFGQARTAGVGRGEAGAAEREAAAGEPVTIEEVLAGGAERVRRNLADHPEIRAEMLSALGAVYDRLGRSDAARPLFEEALEARRAYFDGAHPAVAAALADLAALEEQAGRFGRAEALYRQALALRLRLHDEGHIAVAETRQALGRTLEEAGRAGEATALYEEAVPVYRRVLGSGHGQTAALLTRLAALRCDADDGRAVTLYEEALALERERLGHPHAGLAALRSDLGACLTTLGRYGEAERHLLTSLATLDDTEARHPDRRRHVRERLVALYESWGRPERARRYGGALSARIAE
jgi:serine/threonine-protein kinase